MNVNGRLERLERIAPREVAPWKMPAFSDDFVAEVLEVLAQAGVIALDWPVERILAALDGGCHAECS